ncbi:MAG TPA: Eco57I restriction-modification methylase domain-containing protein [Candidatus Wunengus sp. YC61]|uniref:Eco57I restriction-modification methylase domain-containing protein n=1 Tax=Candidatus Wunengus sp. YC61 TaxID=3367698 RepID=UPI004027D711
MGWNNDRTKQAIILDEIPYNVTAIAEKSGFRIFLCEPPSGNKIPASAMRKKIEGKLTKLFQEHLIIFIDEYKREQVWQLAVRKAGSPTKISETRFTLSQDPELLYQRASGLFFTLDEEEKVTIIDVTRRVADNFQQNNERVTKKFYESFKKEHNAFLKFIQGIDDQLNMDWYASLMLNRLMFCYFIQKKGFLDHNKNYLQDKLKACKEKKGKNQFYSFYRDFLLALFHKGLGAPEQSRRGDTGIALEIGKIPYLNGGLFDEHEIEKAFKNIAIDDKAFEELFDFFDQYEWHLDTRKSASGKDINPDVIGYIFEKYINDRAQMGAYYTQEDITDYVSKNCIIPWLFDEVKRQYPKAFADDGWLWRMVKTSGDEYIYDAVKYGVPESGGLFDDLPAEIQKGFGPELEKKVVDGNGPWLWELRKSWNKPAPSDIALPTETYREVIERRKRYADIKAKIANGEIKEINDFITYNLNIRQFAQDVLETTEDAEFIRYFYQALLRITILDPTCGSGAFLFAALNILELLYEACIQRMRGFVDENGKGKHKFFEATLAQVDAPEHPNLQYFIYKSIILNNLYGVDIMKEAVEIAKLRLFLKLVATVDADYRKPNLGLEPLPDVDFNIRAGNTLVGYATEAQLNEAFVGTRSSMLDFDNDSEKIKEKCDIVARAFARYKEIQLRGNADFEDFKTAKDDLNERLDKLRNELDVLLHKQHYPNVKYDQWLATHQPFHWFAEFYEIVQGKDGFDVMIGNPPYVEYKDVCKFYQIQNVTTEECSNLFAFVLERCTTLSRSGSAVGMIIPLSAFSTDRMIPLITHLKNHSSQLKISNFSWRPGKMFDGVHLQLAIMLQRIAPQIEKIETTRYLMWDSEARPELFSKIEYATTTDNRLLGSIPKLGPQEAAAILTKLRLHKKEIGACFTRSSINRVLYRRGGLYWKVFVDFETGSSEEKIIHILPEVDKYGIIAALSSDLWWWYFTITSDCRHLGNRDISTFPFDPHTMSADRLKSLCALGREYVKDLKRNAENAVRVYKGKKAVECLSFRVNQSKSIIDQIDCLLAQHYGFTHEELDFIINYDIKYRMGKELEEVEE